MKPLLQSILISFLALGLLVQASFAQENTKNTQDEFESLQDESEAILEALAKRSNGKIIFKKSAKKSESKELAESKNKKELAEKNSESRDVAKSAQNLQNKKEAQTLKIENGGNKKHTKISPKIPDFKVQKTPAKNSLDAGENKANLADSKKLKDAKNPATSADKSEIKTEKSADIAEIAVDQSSQEELAKRIKEELERDIKKAQADNEKLENLPKAHSFYQSIVKSGNMVIYSSNYDARNLGTQIAEILDEVMVSIFGRINFYTQPIEIRMLLEKEADFKGSFLESSSTSSAILYVKTNSELSLEEFCRRAISLYLRVYALNLSGASAYKDVPYWLELAVSARLAQKISGAITIESARYAVENPPELLDKVFEYSRAKNDDLKAMEVSAYWNLLALRAAYTGEFSNLMCKILANPQNREKILAEIKLKNGGKNFDIHWRAILLGEIYARLGGVKNLPDSDAEVLRLSVLTRQRQGEPFAAVFDTDIFELAKFNKSLIEDRIYEIKLTLPWVNPVYYNALVALGKMYDAANEGDIELFKSARADFLTELKNARLTAESVRKLLKK